MAILVCILLAASVSRRIRNTVITLPMIYTAMGLLVSPIFLNLVEIDPSSLLLHIIAEVTLVIVLANDASRIDIRQLWRDHSLPQRLLLICLPLTMVCGRSSALLARLPLNSTWSSAGLVQVMPSSLSA